MAANKRRKRPVIAGRFGPHREPRFELLEERQPTTSYPKAGESIQPHVILLRAPVYEIVEEVFAAGLTYETRAGMRRVALQRPITGDDYYNALLAAYGLIGITGRAAREKITTKRGEHVKIGSFSVLTETSKMGCYSFNLPAGPVFQGGTCPASELGFMMQTDAELAKQQKRLSVSESIDVGDFICNGCYAIKGCYGNPSMVFMMGLRKKLVQDWMAEGTFVERMVAAIDGARGRSRKRMSKARKANRWKIPHPDFFRIHDAGDMFSPAYTRAWFDVCEALPDVNFWAPTRMWALSGGTMREVRRGVPANLALRPSALHFGEAPPRVIYAGSARAAIGGEAAPGIAAGSGSGPTPPRRAWECPAYEHVTRGGGAEPVMVQGAEVLKGGTCARAHGPESPFRGGDDPMQSPDTGYGCRACWLAPDRPIFYHEH